MTANLMAKGKLDTIAKSLNGSFTFSAKKGEILKSKSLDKTLDLVNKTENVKGKLPDLDRTKIKYRVFTASGNIKEHIIEVEQSMLDDSSFGLLAQGQVDLYDQTVDLNALVAPLNFAQSSVGKIPALGHLMGGNIVSVPVKIKGNLSDPQVTFLSASAIGSAFLGIMERTPKLPITIIEPILPTTSTASALENARAGSIGHQASATTADATSTAGTKYAATRSAICATAGRSPPARSTSPTIVASTDSAPVRVTRTTSGLSPF